MTSPGAGMPDVGASCVCDSVGACDCVGWVPTSAGLSSAAAGIPDVGASCACGSGPDILPLGTLEPSDVDPETCRGPSKLLPLTGKASPCTPKSCLLPPRLPCIAPCRSGVLDRFASSLSLRSCILPLIQDIGPRFSRSESEKTAGSVLEGAMPVLTAGCCGLPLGGSVAEGVSGAGSWKDRRGCDPEKLLLPTVDRDIAFSFVPKGLAGGGAGLD